MTPTFEWLKLSAQEKSAYIRSVRSRISAENKNTRNCNNNKDSKSWWASLSNEEKDAYVDRINKIKALRRVGSRIVYMPATYSRLGDCEIEWIDYYRIHKNGRIEASSMVRRRLKKLKGK